MRRKIIAATITLAALFGAGAFAATAAAAGTSAGGPQYTYYHE